MAKKPPTKRLSYLPKNVPDGWPVWRCQSEQGQLEEEDEIARALWEVFRNQHNRFRNRLIQHKENPVDEHWPSWQDTSDSVRNAWRRKAQTVIRGPERPAKDDEDLVKRVAESIYNLNPWCRPEKTASGSIIVTEVPWDQVGWPSEVGQDIRRRAELYARTAVRIVRENDRDA